MSIIKKLGWKSHWREMPTPPRRCPCGRENVRRGQVVGKACYFAAPANLRKDAYSKDPAVARAAWVALKDFAARNAALQPKGLTGTRQDPQSSIPNQQ